MEALQAQLASLKQGTTGSKKKRSSAAAKQPPEPPQARQHDVQYKRVLEYLSRYGIR